MRCPLGPSFGHIAQYHTGSQVYRRVLNLRSACDPVYFAALYLKVWFGKLLATMKRNSQYITSSRKHATNAKLVSCTLLSYHIISYCIITYHRFRDATGTLINCYPTLWSLSRHFCGTIFHRGYPYGRNPFVHWEQGHSTKWV